jgi:hypothetical protein
MSDVTAAIDRLRHDVEQIENHHAMTQRERGHQIGRIVTALQGILEEFTTSMAHIQKELETISEVSRMKQIQLFTTLLDVQAAIEYEAPRMPSLAQEQAPEITGEPQVGEQQPETARQLVERFQEESVVIETAEFAESMARRRQRVARAATG